MIRRGRAARRFSRSNPRWVAVAVEWAGAVASAEDSQAAEVDTRAEAAVAAIRAEAAVIQVVAAVTQARMGAARMATARNRRVQ